MFNMNQSFAATEFETVMQEGSHMEFPAQDEVRQLGENILREVMLTFGRDAMEPYAQLIGTRLINGIQMAINQINSDMGFAQAEIAERVKANTGGEIDSVAIEEATQKARFCFAAIRQLEEMRDGAAEVYHVETGDIWTPARGSQRNGSKTSFAIMEAREALRAMNAHTSQGLEAGAEVVVFRGVQQANTKTDQEKIFKWLDRALQRHPAMVLACSGQKGAEKIALSWAKAKGVKVILQELRQADGKTGPFKVNDKLLAFKPVLVLTLPKSLEDTKEEAGNGIILNIGQKAEKMKIRHYDMTAA
jgi:hypothetical protein